MLMAAHEREREAIARELHDDITQVLAATAIDLSLVLPRLGAPDAQGDVERLIDRLRNLSRRVHEMSHQMHPHALRTLGLARALEGECRAFAARTGIGMKMRIEPDGPDLPPDVALAAFRVAQEALNNIAKHARATAVRVDLEQTGAELRLTIKDTGRGFAPSARRAGIGLLGMKERALAVGGRATVVSSPGKGATVTITVPLSGGEP
jgi:signal transduction histidine kinase